MLTAIEFVTRTQVEEIDSLTRILSFHSLMGLSPSDLDLGK